MMTIKYTMIFEIDTNDADYIEDTTTVNEETFSKFKVIFKKLEGIKHLPRIEDYSRRELDEVLLQYLTEDEANLLGDYIPVGEYGYATLESVRFIPGEPEYLWRERF